MKTKLLNPAWRMLTIASPPRHCGGTWEEVMGSNHLRMGRRARNRLRNVTEEKLDLGQEYWMNSSRQKVRLMLLQAERQARRKAQRNGARHIWEMRSILLRLEADFDTS